MSKAFQVGERVAFYQKHHRGVATILNVNMDGTLAIQVVDSPDALRGIGVVHSMQCRRLRKRERRRVWVYFPTAGDAPPIATARRPGNTGRGWVEFVEVRQ